MATDSHGMGIELPADSTPIHQFPGVTRLAMERVAELLAGDITPGVAAAIAEQVGPAVDAEIAEAGVLHGASNTGNEEVALSFTDQSDRRSWLEVTKAGRPSKHSAAILHEDLGLELMPEEIHTGAGFAFVITDQNDRIAFGVRLDGTTTAGGAAPAPAADPAAVILPATIGMVVGKTYRLNYSDFVGDASKDHTVTVASAGNGSDYGTYWECTPAAAGTFNLAVTVYDRAGKVVTTKTAAVTKYVAPSGAGKRLLSIGDSITRDGTYVREAVAALAGAATVGTRTYDNAALNREGRGGWTLAGYLTTIGSAAAGDSPFLFPVGIAGAKYHGNTEFWRKVCNVPMAELPSNGYDFDGFQYIARGWKPAGNPYLYDAAGYPVAPAEGDVVVDPTKAAGATFRQYTAGAWTTMAPQPAIEFNFSKYMERYAAAFPNGGPTHVSLMLETNDFFTAINDGLFDTWLGRLNTVIASVRAWSATVPFIVLLAPTGGPHPNWTAQTNPKFIFDRNMQDAAKRILAAVQTTAMANNKVSVATFLGSVAPANMSDHVHPTSTGHGQMAPWLAGKLAQLITEGA